jgi:AcrR family transcriptional regulator
LAGAALREVSAEMRAAADDLLDGEADPLRAVLAWLTAPREGLRGCRLGRLVAEPILDDPAIAEPVAAYFRHVRARLASRLAEADAGGRLREGTDPADLAAALVAAVQGGYVLARASRDPADMRRAQRGAAMLLHGSVTGPIEDATNPIDLEE